MYPAKVIPKLVGGTYDSAGDLTRWEGLLGGLGHVVDCVVNTLNIRGPKAALLIQPSTDRDDLLFFFASILAAYLIGTHIARWQIGRQAEDELKRKMNLSFEKLLPDSAAQEERPLSVRERTRFFTGGWFAPPFSIVRRRLAAPRNVVGRIMAEIRREARAGFFHFEIVGHRKQGKTFGLAQLAHQLAQDRQNEVLWCRNGKIRPPFLNPNAEDFLNPNLLKTYARITNRYRLIRKKKVVVVVDDIFPPNVEDTLAWQRRLYEFHSQLASSDVMLLTAGTESLELESSRTYRISLEDEDRDRILDKMRSLTELPLEPNAILKVQEGAGLYGRNLAAFFFFVLDQVVDIRSSGFHEHFRDAFRSLTKEEKEVLSYIACFELLDIDFPEVAAEEGLSLREYKALRSGWSGIVERRTRGPDGRVCYGLAAPFLALWLLRDCFGIQGKAAFTKLCHQAIEHVLKSPPRFMHEEKATTAMLFLRRLVDDWQQLAYPDIRGLPIARSILKEKGHLLREFFEELEVEKDKNSLPLLVGWAATLGKLRQEEEATNLYFDCLSIYNSLETVDPSTAAYLAIGLAHARSRQLRERSAELFKTVWDEMVKTKIPQKLINQICYAFANLLVDLGRTDQALSVIDTLPRAHLDAPLLCQKAEIFELLDRLREAYKCFKLAVEKASGRYARNPSKMIICLQRFAIFVSRHGNSLKLREDPSTCFQEAATLAENTGGPYESVLSAWAANLKARGDYNKAKDIFEKSVSYCGDQGIVHPHTLNGLAKLLIDYADKLPGKTPAEWFAEAEEYCCQVVETGYADRNSTLISYHILGTLIGGWKQTYTSKDGKQRPDNQEAVEMLQEAFSSGPSERNDPELKSWQDILTHRALADVYFQWSEQKGLEEAETFWSKADFHYKQAIDGLPRTPDLADETVLDHLARAKQSYETFQKRVRWRSD